MNRQLIAQACRKFAEAFSLLEEGIAGQSEDPTATVTAAATTEAAAPATTKSEPAKKARKSAAPKAAPKVEEPEETEEQDEDAGTEDANETEAEEGDDLADLEDDSEEVATVTRDALRKNIVAYAKKHGKPKAYGLLEKFGAKNVDGLKEKDLDKVNTQIQKGLK